MKPKPLLSIVATLTIVGTTSAQQDSPAGRPGDRPVRKLQVEHRDTLQQLVEIRQKEYREGHAPIVAVLDAVSELIEAKLDLAEDRSERLTLCRDQVELLRQVEAVARAQFNTGQVGQGDLLVARARRLKAEIRLAQEDAGRL